MTRSANGADEPVALEYEESVFDRAYATGMLVLTNQEMDEFPELPVTNVPHIRLLDLSGNRIQHIPSTLLAFSGLKSIFLNQNRFECDCISKMI